MRIVLENNDGFYRDLITVSSKEEAEAFIRGFKVGRDAMMQLEKLSQGEAFTLGYTTGMNVAQSSDIYKSGFNEGFRNPIGKVQVKE